MRAHLGSFVRHTRILVTHYGGPDTVKRLPKSPQITGNCSDTCFESNAKQRANPHQHCSLPLLLLKWEE